MKIAEEMLTLNDGRTLVLRSAEEKDAVTMLDYIKQTAEETHYRNIKIFKIFLENNF
jgi:hypothetical protein